MAKPEPNEPNLVEVNRLIRTEPAPDAKTIDVEHALAVLRAENAGLRDRVKAAADTAAQAEQTHKRDRDSWRRETISLQDQLIKGTNVAAFP